MRMRRRGAPLVRAAATAAVIGGTAGAVHSHQQRKWANQEQAEYESEQQAAMQEQMYQQQLQMQQMQQQMAMQQAQAAPAGRLADDGSVESAGPVARRHILDDAEFAAAKKKLLAGG